VRELYVGGYGKFVSVLNRMSPRLLDWYMTRRGRMFRGQQDRRPNDHRDTLEMPSSRIDGARGRFGHRARAHSVYSRYLDPHPLFRGALVGAFLLGLAAALVEIGRATKTARKVPSRRVRKLRPRRFDDPRVALIRDAYVPVVRALLDAGIDPRELPRFAQVETSFMNHLAHLPSAGESDPRPRSPREHAAPPSPRRESARQRATR
jgi:hypothetical protein